MTLGKRTPHTALTVPQVTLMNSFPAVQMTPSPTFRPKWMSSIENTTKRRILTRSARLLTRLLQLKILKNTTSTETIFEFIRDFRVAMISDRKFINLYRNSEFIRSLSISSGLPLTQFFSRIPRSEKYAIIAFKKGCLASAKATTRRL